MPKPKVFVTRIIPDAGLDKVREFCDADVWSEPLPPSADELKKRIAGCEGLLSLLTERIDGPVLDVAPTLKVVSNYAVWVGGTMYPHTMAGLGTCYLAALPFYRNDLLSTLLVTGLAVSLPAMARRISPQ